MYKKYIISTTNTNNIIPNIILSIIPIIVISIVSNYTIILIYVIILMIKYQESLPTQTYGFNVI